MNKYNKLKDLKQRKFKEKILSKNANSHVQNNSFYLNTEPIMVFHKNPLNKGNANITSKIIIFYIFFSKELYY